jgi:hypothetical protein
VNAGRSRCLQRERNWPRFAVVWLTEKGPSQFLQNELLIYKTNKCTSDTQSNSVIMSCRGTEYFVSLYTSVVITDMYNVTVNSQELIGTTEYLM